MTPRLVPLPRVLVPLRCRLIRQLSAVSTAGAATRGSNLYIYIYRFFAVKFFEGYLTAPAVLITLNTRIKRHCSGTAAAPTAPPVERAKFGKSVAEFLSVGVLHRRAAFVYANANHSHCDSFSIGARVS